MGLASNRPGTIGTVVAGFASGGFVWASVLMGSRCLTTKDLSAVAGVLATAASAVTTTLEILSGKGFVDSGFVDSGFAGSGFAGSGFVARAFSAEAVGSVTTTFEILRGFGLGFPASGATVWATTLVGKNAIALPRAVRKMGL